MAFYNNWRRIRQSRGITMSEASRALGISKPRLSQIENGSPHGTTLRVMKEACRLYSCQMSDLYLYLPAGSEEMEEKWSPTGAAEALATAF